MSSSVVWFVPPERVADGVGQILEQSGFFARTRPRKKVGIKTHFGENDNNNHISPELVRSAAIACINHDLQPVAVETTALYRGRRQRASEHIKLAREHGFTVERTLVPIEILDGEYGEHFYPVALDFAPQTPAYLAGRLRFIRYLVNLAHFKGHFVAGFGGAIKSIAMGLAAKAGKLAMHSSSKPYVDEEKCLSCGNCVDYCPHDAIDFVKYVARIGRSCTGCGGCLAVCPHGAIKINWDAASESVQKKLAEYCYAVLKDRVAIHFNIVLKVTPNCDCYPQTENPIMPDVGLFASFDPVACDQAAWDHTRSALKEIYPHLNPEIVLARGEEIGLGKRNYQLVSL
ncbi:DUF362 domain-containing protein [candidate division WOR-3 bacterium]|nr:DUF362 domain-containing protein [candidate division WOR-3 bacterium]